MFKLKHYFSIVSLIAIAVSAVTLSSYYRHTTIEQLIEVEERSYLALTQTIANTIWPKYHDFLKQAESLPRAQLVKHPLSEMLHNDVAEMVQGLPILKIKIYDIKGKILFSTDLAQTGKVKPANYSGSKVALTGKVISKIRYREKFNKIDGSDVYDLKVLSSYLPIKRGLDNKVVGVIEIYTDISDTLSEIENKQYKVVGIVLVILGLLYLVLYIFIAKANKILIRQHKKLKQATEVSSRFGRLLDSSSNEIYIFNADNFYFTHVNRGGRDNLGYSIEELYELKAWDLNVGISQNEFLSYLEPLCKLGHKQLNFEAIYKRKDGSTYPVDVRLQLSSLEDPPVYVAMVLDITERKKAEDQLNYLAYYDNLTGLPNRRLFIDRLQQAMKEANRNEKLVAVLFVDLDRFKKINDSMGHETGDILLKEAAQRLRNCVRESDTVARLGGDEFTLVLSSILHVDNAINVAEHILENFSSPFHIKNLDLFISASIGITLYPLDDNSADDLLRDADTAMYHAKENGRNNFQFYNNEMTARVEERLKLERELREALARNEFILFYQPQVDTENGTVVGMEALIRWQHPQQGLIEPDHFISVAEETGLIIPIGKWVLQEACKQTQLLHTSGVPPIHVSVNLSARQLEDPGLVQMVDQVLKETGFEPALLDLEITEGMLMSDMDRVIQTLEELSALGVTISVDDFGTGHSSLAYIKRFPISTLKIDRSFIRDTPENKDDMSITIAIINMAYALGLKTVAEGVKTKEQFDFLKQYKCNMIQGYYFSKPIAFNEILKLFQTGQGENKLVRINPAA